MEKKFATADPMTIFQRLCWRMDHLQRQLESLLESNGILPQRFFQLDALGKRVPAERLAQIASVLDLDGGTEAVTWSDVSRPSPADMSRQCVGRLWRA